MFQHAVHFVRMFPKALWREHYFTFEGSRKPFCTSVGRRLSCARDLARAVVARGLVFLLHPSPETRNVLVISFHLLEVVVS